MQLFQLPLLLALAHSIPLTLALALPADLPTSPLIPRSRQCTNNPSQTAGTALQPRSRSHFQPRTPTMPLGSLIWCDPGRETFLVIRAGWAVFNNYDPIDALLYTVLRLGLAKAQSGGDRVLRAGEMDSQVSNMLLRVANANNHQLTLGVFLDAMRLLKEFLNAKGGFQSVSFDIYDGNNQVGTGSIT